MTEAGRFAQWICSRSRGAVRSNRRQVFFCGCCADFWYPRSDVERRLELARELDDNMDEEKYRVRAALYRLLLDDEAGAASTLVPRMLADPDSLTPEIRCCLVYLIRGIGYLAARNDLLGHGGLLDTLAEKFDPARIRTRRIDGLWFDIVQEDPAHWVQRYESTDQHYSLEELSWLNLQLGCPWEIERP